MYIPEIIHDKFQQIIARMISVKHFSVLDFWYFKNKIICVDSLATCFCIKKLLLFKFYLNVHWAIPFSLFSPVKWGTITIANLDNSGCYKKKKNGKIINNMSSSYEFCHQICTRTSCNGRTKVLKSMIKI